MPGRGSLQRTGTCESHVKLACMGRQEAQISHTSSMLRFRRSWQEGPGYHASQRRYPGAGAVDPCRLSLVRSSDRAVTLVMSLGRNIRRLRLAAGFQTQKEFASHLGVPQPQASDWENDRYGILETMTILKIAKSLGCSVDELLVGVDPAYDRMRETHEEMPVVAEGEALPEGGSARGLEFAEPVQRLSRPGDLQDPRVYGVRILGESMFPAYRPGMVAIAAPHCPARDGDEVYAHLVSGERLVRVVHAVARGFVLQP